MGKHEKNIFKKAQQIIQEEKEHEERMKNDPEYKKAFIENVDQKIGEKVRKKQQEEAERRGQELMKAVNRRRKAAETRMKNKAKNKGKKSS